MVPLPPLGVVKAVTAAALPRGAPARRARASLARRLRGSCRRYRSRAARDRQRSRSRTATSRSDERRHRHHRRGGRRGRCHRRPHREYSPDPSRWPTGSLRPISRRLKASWSEAWSVYASVLTSFHPRLATRLFHYQHFITLKSRSFRMTAWLLYVSHGFDIGYQGLHMDIRAPNLPLAAAHPEVVTEYLLKECAAGCMAGSFPQPPFSPFHCSGLGVVPKKDGSWRIITHLSAPDGLSINDHIDPGSVTLRYTTIDKAVKISQ